MVRNYKPIRIKIMKKLEKFFDIKTPCDKKHKLNTCNKKVSQDYLNKIEDGCSLEQLEEMTRNKFDVFKYGTQITIHGLFPELSVRRIGGYVNIVQNKNKSIGVRYTAIDRHKKDRLFTLLNSVSNWSIRSRSTEYFIYKLTPLPDNRDEALKIVSDYKSEAEKIDKSLFIGNVSCYVAEYMFRRYICLDVNICCFYEKNFNALFANLSGMSLSEGEKLREEKRRKKEAERARLEEKWKKKSEEREKEREQAEARFQEVVSNFISETPPPSNYTKRENYELKAGDKVCLLYFDKYDKMFVWVECVCKKCFGKIHIQSIDRNFSDYGYKLITLDWMYVAIA